MHHILLLSCMYYLFSNLTLFEVKKNTIKDGGHFIYLLTTWGNWERRQAGNWERSQLPRAFFPNLI